MRVYLIRHGRPDMPDNQKRYIGRTDIPLSEAGRQSAEETAHRIKDVECFFTSPLSRCTAYAHFLSKGQFPVQILPELAELNMGQWDGLTFDEVRRKWPGAYVRRGQTMGTFRPPGGESFFECQKRAAKALNHMTNYGYETVAAITHSGVIRSLLCWLDCGDMSRDLFSYRILYGSVILLESEPGKAEFHSYRFMENEPR